MKIKILAAALLVAASTSSFAVVTREYNTAVFVATGDAGVYELNGFGRVVEGSPQPALGVGLPGPAEARESFHDIQNIDVSALLPGNYVLSSHDIVAVGSVLFTNATLNSYNESGARVAVDLDIVAGGTKVIGTGSFVVRSECPVVSCVWIDLYGTQVIGDALADYSGTVTAQVPEPASWALMLGGLGLAGALARRRGKALA